MLRNHYRLLWLVALCAGGATAVRAQPQRGPLAGLTRAEVDAVMRDTTSASYASDGTARSDTARRLATAGAWDIEGGDQQRGFRLFQAAWRLGVADSVFYQDAVALARLLGCPAEEVTAAVEARRRWPTATWADSAYARALRARERAAPAALRRACPVRFQAAAPAR